MKKMSLYRGIEYNHICDNTAQVKEESSFCLTSQKKEEEKDNYKINIDKCKLTEGGVYKHAMQNKTHKLSITFVKVLYSKANRI